MVWRKDLIASFVLLLLAAVYYAASTGIASSSLEDAFGPRGLPAVLALALALIAVAMAARAIQSAPAHAREQEEEEASVPRALGLLLIGAAYVPLAWFAGYFIALAVLLVAVALYERMRLSWRLAAVALGGAGFFWLLFEYVLDVEQPAGLLF